MTVIACSDLQAVWVEGVIWDVLQMEEWLHSKVTGLFGNTRYVVCTVEVSTLN